MLAQEVELIVSAVRVFSKLEGAIEGQLRSFKSRPFQTNPGFHPGQIAKNKSTVSVYTKGTAKSFSKDHF
jgi:hypothetical protein